MPISAKGIIGTFHMEFARFALMMRNPEELDVLFV
jgi:hypothetical protein